MLIVHIVCFLLGILFIFAAFILSVLLLLQNRRLKLKQPAAWMKLLPPLETIDRLILRLIIIGFPFITVGLVLGFLLAHHSWLSGWGGDPKVLFALACWLWYALLLQFRLAFGWRGTRLAWLNIFGFMVIVFTALGVEALFHSSAHRSFFDWQHFWEN
jgi:ABC-type transport system involved in cytochrome c biogenesis permease subunit